MRPALSIVVIATLLTAACRGSEPEATGGVTGTVIAGPTCPVELEGSPCPPAPWRGIVRATDGDGRTFETETGEDGRYTLILPPGIYVVSAVTGTTPPTAIPVEVTVGEGTPRPLDLEVDTGIR